jgi:hypothetical protein
MEDLSRFCCQNSECPDYGKGGGPEICRCAIITGRESSVACCGVPPASPGFPSGRGRCFFGSSLPEEKILSVLEHVVEGCGTRKTGRLVGVHRDTVTRHSRLAGNHARAVHDELVAFSPEHPRGAV